MAQICFRLDIFLFLLAFLVVGCGRQSNPSPQRPLAATNSVTNSPTDATKQTGRKKAKARPPEVLTPDRACLKKAQKALDDGDILEAMKLSRGLMDSKDVSVRADLIDIFGWIGKKAMPELAELMRDPEPDIASAAATAWEFALGEMSYDFVKIAAITNLVSKLENPVVIDSLLMHTLDMELRYSLPALEGLVIGCRGKTCGQCAKRMFEHIAGEPWASPERTSAILKEQGETK